MIKKLTYGVAAASLAALFSTTANALVIDGFGSGPQKMQIVNGTGTTLAFTGKLLDNAPGCALVADTTACTDGSAAGSSGSSFTQSGVGPVAGILGGYRDIVTEMIAGSPSGSATSALANFAGGVTFSHNQDSGATSNTFITWGGTGDQLAGAGLVGLDRDLTDGGLSNQFHLIIINADAGVNWSLQLTDGDSTFTHPFANPAAIVPPGTHLYIPFGIFTAGGITMTDVRFIRFGANVTNVANFDTTVDFFETTGVPEPASMTLLGAGLMGLGYFGKRRKAAAKA